MHAGAFLDSDARSGDVALDLCGPLEDDGFGSSELPRDRAAHGDARAADVPADGSLLAERDIASDVNVTFYAPQNLDRTFAPDIAADDGRLANDGSFCHLCHTSMSTLPLNEAPSAIVKRDAFTSPMRRPPAWMSTRSSAVTFPVT